MRSIAALVRTAATHVSGKLFKGRRLLKRQEKKKKRKKKRKKREKRKKRRKEKKKRGGTGGQRGRYRGKSFAIARG